MVALTLILIIFILILLSIITYYYYVYFMTKNRLKNIPTIEPNISNTKAVFDDLLIKYPKIYGKSFWLMVGFEPILFSTDQKLIKIILSSQNHIEKPGVVKLLKRFGNNGLIAANENIWKNHRKLLNPSFHYKILEENYLETFNIESNRFVNDLEKYLNKDSFEIVSKAKLWSFRQASETLLGLETDSNRKLNPIYMEKLENLMEIVYQRAINPLEYFDLTYFFTKNFWREKRLIQSMDKFILEIIEKKKTEILSGDSKNIKKTILDLMIQALIDEKLTLREVLEEIHTFLFASFESTALTLSYIIYNFASHPEMQEKAFNEIKSNQKSKNLLNNLKYLDLFIKESMRIYTVAGLLPRKLGEKVKWGELILPKGLSIVIPVQAVHNDPENYPDPYQTIPERFIKNQNPYAYIPFSAGPRNCIGSNYAMLALKVCLSKLLLSYKFVSVDHKLKRSVQVIVVSKNGVRIKLERRD